MSDSVQNRRPGIASRRLRLIVACAIGLSCAVLGNIRATAAERYDPFEARPRFHDPFEAKPQRRAQPGRIDRKRAAGDPFDEVPAVAPKADRPKAAYQPHKTGVRSKQVNFQFPAADRADSTDSPSITSPDSSSPAADQAPQVDRSSVVRDPCAAAAEKPLAALGIGIEPPAGQLPTNRAKACWNSINSRFGPLAGARSWTGFDYCWDATCLCHRPLYFEEINLERYGYGCGWCLQPAASAAHFFGTVPALPYLAAVDCPHECIYTLGHYRPGSCPPWRHTWPTCDPLAAAAEGGVLTGLIFLIP